MKINRFALVPALAGLFLLVSCEDRQTTAVSTTCYIENGETPLSEDPECDFSYDYFVKLEYPTKIGSCPSEEVEKAVIDSITMFILNSAFGEDMVSRAIEGRIPGCKDLAAKKNIVTRVAASAIRYNSNDYVKTNLPLWYRTGDALSLSWNDSIESYFKGMKDSYISWIVYRSYYGGGAHGSDFEKCFTIDSETGTPVTEEMIFREGYREELTELLSERAREILPEAVYSTLYSPVIAPNGNFFFSPKGMTWSYGRYEIAPFRTGLIRISLPWEKVESLLRK
ncbi:MAG: RsiV family protein [Bacteroidales bacterium]|nr:RsiV family protein [Bacteroidales bacterium]